MGALKSPRCHNGHPMSGKNLYHRKDGSRECRACSAIRAKNYQRKKAAK